MNNRPLLSLNVILTRNAERNMRYYYINFVQLNNDKLVNKCCTTIENLVNILFITNNDESSLINFQSMQTELNLQ